MSGPTTDVMQAVLNSLNDCRVMLVDRCEGLGEEEYLWEPAAGCWNVREDSNGAWLAEVVKPPPSPSPITTIAWRLWHLGVECFDGYSGGAFGTTATSLTGQQWVGGAREAVALTDAAIENFSAGAGALDEVEIWAPLGPSFGPYRDHSMVDLVLHAEHELAHHTGEIALLRDLYAVSDG